MSNVEDQIADIRERVASLETDVTWIRRKLEQAKQGGNVVIPVAAVVAGLEVVKAVIERMT